VHGNTIADSERREHVLRRSEIVHPASAQIEKGVAGISIPAPGPDLGAPRHARLTSKAGLA
jgi:hypothetical protein